MNILNSLLTRQCQHIGRSPLHPWTLLPKQQSPYPSYHKPQHNHRHDENPTQLQHSNFIATPRHPCQSPCTSLYSGAHIAEGLGSVINDMLIASIVVDVEGDVLQGGGFSR